ncbi:hypothetical protein vseg_012453 [Gypsophila vaccaria]
MKTNGSCSASEALGDLFKLTQIFISTLHTASSTHYPRPTHIRFKYDDDDDADDVHDSEDTMLIDNDEVCDEMTALGLPLSFQAKTNNHNRDGKLKAKRKVAQHEKQSSQNRTDEQVEVSCTSYEDNPCSADSQIKSINSSSSFLRDQSEHSGCDSNITHSTIGLPDFGVRHMPESICDCEEHVHGRSPVNLSTEGVHDDSQREIEMMCVDDRSELLTASTCSGSNMLDDHLKDGMYVTEQLNEQGSILGSGLMHPESSHSAFVKQPELPDLSKESQNMVVLDQECNYTGTYCGTCGDWSAYWDYSYSKYYFYNAETKLSTWNPPPGMESFASGESLCSVDESNMGLSGADAAFLKHQSEEPQSTDNDMIDKAGLISTDKTRGCGEHTTAILSPAICLDESCVLDNHCHDEITLQSSLDIVEYNNTSENAIDDVTKHMTKKKSRRRKKSIKNKEAIQAEANSIDITKYWCQRYLLFSKFDDGISMDEEGWFSVTPEAIAKHQALCCGGATVIDCFTGVGGNAIQFAKTSKHVIAIDIDPNRIDYAYHNAAIYGVQDNIDFVLGDSLSMASKLKADVVFLSPPWGGPDYVKTKCYNIQMLQPYDGQLLFDTFKVVAPRIIMFLPRNVNVEQLAELCLSADPPWSVEVEKNFLNGKFKAVTAYFRRI